MAIFFDAEVTPDALTAFVRELPTPDDLALLPALGYQTVDDHKVDFSELVQTNRVASFRTSAASETDPSRPVSQCPRVQFAESDQTSVNSG